jgi:hypothetical protein
MTKSILIIHIFYSMSIGNFPYQRINDRLKPIWSIELGYSFGVGAFQFMGRGKEPE